MKFIPFFVLLFLQTAIYTYAQKDTVSMLTKKLVIKEQSKNEHIQWAYKVNKFSSQFSNKVRAANQILGKPNVLPAGGSSVCAWAVEKKSNQAAFIRVAFEKPIKAIQVAVAESYNPGAIEKIILYGKDNQVLIVYQNTPKLLDTSSRMLNVFFEPAPFDIIEGELVLQPEKVPDFEIDAFGISDTTDTIKSRINVASNLKYFFLKESLGANINTEYDEISPVISPDGKTIFFDRKYSPENAGGKSDEDDIWFSQSDTNGNWLPAVNIGPPLNNKGNNFVQSITPDGNTLLLGNIYGEKNFMFPGVSISNKTKNGWSIPVAQTIENFQNLSKSVNFYLTSDNKYLLIAMETDSSYGGVDIFVCFRTGENNWSKPKNLGPTINTAANDFSPFLASDAVTLYYSTSGISGYGKEDVFMARRLDETWLNWSEPRNLCDAINTKGSDTKFTTSASGKYIYFSSTENSTGLNDIFKIRLPEEVKPIDEKLLLTHTTKSENTKIVYKVVPFKLSFDSLKGIIQDAFTEKNINDAKVFVVNKITGDTIAYSTGNNNGEFSLIVPKKDESIDERDLQLVIVKDGFEKKVINIDTEYFESEYQIIGNVDTKMNVEIKVDKVIEFHNIYFNYGKAELNQNSISVLDKIIQIMNENEKMAIELSAHTDCRSSADFNLNLSEKRANSAKNYMVSKGISEERITAKGYGKTRLLVLCKNNDCLKCSEQEHAANRRIEFKILKM